MRRRLAGLAVVLLAAVTAARAHAQVAPADCDPVLDLLFQPAEEPVLRQVAAGGERVHFVKDGSAQAGCPNAGAACLARGFVVPGDPVVVTRTRGDFACATFTGPAPQAVSTSGWLPGAALLPPPAADIGPAGWLGDWRCGPEQEIRADRAPGGRIALDGQATFGGRDPDRVKRGAVNTGDFSAVVPAAGDRLAFLVGDAGAPWPYDAARAKAESLCGLRLWRLGPYLVAADNLQCGGANVTFTGVYRRVGTAP